jgi:iron complex outermembrane receptor protein
MHEPDPKLAAAIPGMARPKASLVKLPLFTPYKHPPDESYGRVLMAYRLKLVSSSLIAIAFCQPALAQDAPAVDEGDATAEAAEASERTSAPEIVVTGTRIATNVQDVPIAITAVTAEALEDRQVTEFAQLGSIVPNATFLKSGAIYGAGVSVTIRGIGITDTQFSQEPAVAYYIDDVYYPFVFGSNFDLLDLQHVEVLRGPQGTLFGRNAISGAVNLVGRKPSLTDTSGYVELKVGSRNRTDVRAGLNIPLSPTLAVSGSMVSKRQVGYVEVLDFRCQMFLNGTPELAGTYPFLTSATSFVGEQRPDNCVMDHYGGENERAARGALRWQPFDRIELNIAGEYSYANNESAAEVITDIDRQLTAGHLRELDELGGRWGPYTGEIDEFAPGVDRDFITLFDIYSIPGAPFRFDQRFLTGSNFKTFETNCDILPNGYFIPGNTYYNGSLFRGGNCWGRRVPVETWGVNGKLRVDITDEITALAIVGHRNIYTKFGANYDGTPLVDAYIYHEDKMEYWTGELRMTGQHGWLDWVAGLFYYDGTAIERGQPQNTRNGTQQYHDVNYYPQAKAAFLNVTFRPYEAFGIIEGLSLSGGIRRSDDEKFVEYSALFDASEPGSLVFTPASSSTVFDLLIANKRWDWKLGADYKVTEDIMVYASAATGYRLPGFNTRIFQAGQTEQQFPTALISYEVGFKADIFDRRLRLNGNVFYMDYSMRNASFSGAEPRYDPSAVDLVIKPGLETLIVDGPNGTAWENSFSNCRPYNPATDGPPNGTTVGIECIQRTWNYPVSGGDPIKGFELEVVAEPINDLVANFSMGYTDRGSTTGRPTGFPDWTLNGGIQYAIELPSLEVRVTPRLDWFWRGRIAYDVDYTEFDSRPYSLFNARISVDHLDGYSLAFGVTNLTNKEYFVQRTIFTRLAGMDIGQPGEPRSWYLSLSKRF